MKVKIKRLTPTAQVPHYATPGSACFDLVADSIEDTGWAPRMLTRDSPRIYGTGLVFEIPPGKVMLIFSRSGHGFNDDIRLSNCVGVIDSDYRGEVKVKLAKDTMGYHTFVEGSRIAQAMIVDFERVDFEVVESLEPTARGEGGFGSTGT
jgi:dUTP pyrophosphatase